MARKEIKSEITINATPQTVWKYLTDFGSYPDWNPFILSFEGKFANHENVKVRIKPYGSKPMDFKPVILKIDKNKEIRWKGVLWVKGLFDGEHYMKLTDKNSSTLFIQGESFSGILVPFLKKLIDPKTLKGFQLMNEKLKKRVESKAHK